MIPDSDKIKLWQILVDGHIDMRGFGFKDIGGDIDVVNDINIGGLNTTITFLSKVIYSDEVTINDVLRVTHFKTNDPTDQSQAGPLWQLGHITDGEITISLDGDLYSLITKSWLESNLQFKHEQNVPSNTWTIPHGLGLYPDVHVLEKNGAQYTKVVCDVDYTDSNNLTLIFSEPIEGRAILTNHF